MTSHVHREGVCDFLGRNGHCMKSKIPRVVRSCLIVSFISFFIHINLVKYHAENRDGPGWWWRIPQDRWDVEEVIIDCLAAVSILCLVIVVVCLVLMYFDKRYRKVEI